MGSGTACDRKHQEKKIGKNADCKAPVRPACVGGGAGSGTMARVCENSAWPKLFFGKDPHTSQKA